jgi:short subunit dehydrogenase-like uncharacterized protein
MELSGGTAASSVGIMLGPSFRFHRGALVTDRPGSRTRAFDVAGRRRSGLSIGGSEHLFLPELAPWLSDIGVYLGWFGPVARLSPVAALMTRGLNAVPGAASALSGAATKQRGSGGGPDARARARATSLVIAEALDEDGALLARVELTGPNPYTLTGRLLAWAAQEALAGRVQGAGVLGPVQAFGLDALTAGCAAIGLVEAAS